MGSSLQCMTIGYLFLNITPVAQILRATINKWDLLKMRSFYKAKKIVNKTKRQPTEWKKVFINPKSDKGLISKMYKELKKLHIKILNNPVLKMGYKTNQRILNKRIACCQKTLKEMFNILSHQGNENKNNSEIPFYTCQNG